MQDPAYCPPTEEDREAEQRQTMCLLGAQEHLEEAQCAFQAYESLGDEPFPWPFDGVIGPLSLLLWLVDQELVKDQPELQPVDPRAFERCQR